jgi:hypothetical protein
MSSFAFRLVKQAKSKGADRYPMTIMVTFLSRKTGSVQEHLVRTFVDPVTGIPVTGSTNV